VLGCVDAVDVIGFDEPVDLLGVADGVAELTAVAPAATVLSVF